MAELKNLRKRLEITREWAEQFRAMHEQTPAEAPAGVAQVIHDAMRQSFLAQAEELDAEAVGLQAGIHAEIAVRCFIFAIAIVLVAAALA